MTLNYAAFIIPAFFIFAGLEFWYAKKKRITNYYGYEDTIANITVGIAERLLSLLVTASFFSLFYFVYENYALFNLPVNIFTWLALLVITDFVWYWYHRSSHEINIFWAAHVVHHQSEYYNLSISARITVLQSFIRNIFWCALPLLGFPPMMVIVSLVVHGFYSFFIHTQLVKFPRWAENIFISPQLHSVHHASNEKYLNKNYGSIFVFWDKIFGTFQTKEEQPIFGLTKPLKSYSFLWQHFHNYAEIAIAFTRATTFTNKIKTLLGKPEYLDASIRTEIEKKILPQKETSLSKHTYRNYVNAQIILALVTLFSFTFLYNHIDTVNTAFISILTILTLINCCALLEQRKWIHYLEYIRLLTLHTFFSYNINSIEYFISIGTLLIAFIIALPVKHWYDEILFGNYTTAEDNILRRQ